jgi:hypothetical protein
MYSSWECPQKSDIYTVSCSSEVGFSLTLSRKDMGSKQENSRHKNTKKEPGMATHTFNPSTREAEVGRFLSSRPAWSTKWVPGQPGLYRETLSRKTKKKRIWKKKPEQFQHTYTHLLSFTGFIFIPNPFLPGCQRHWVKQCLKLYSQKPNVCNLDKHMTKEETQGLWEQSKEVLR